LAHIFKSTLVQLPLSTFKDVDNFDVDYRNLQLKRILYMTDLEAIMI
jgi:hypothetical protein